MNRAKNLLDSLPKRLQDRIDPETSHAVDTPKAHGSNSIPQTYDLKDDIEYKKSGSVENPDDSDLLRIIRQLFDLYDTDADGYLNNDDIKNLIMNNTKKLNFAKVVTDDQLDATIKKYDNMGDNKFEKPAVFQILKDLKKGDFDQKKTSEIQKQSDSAIYPKLLEYLQEPDKAKEAFDLLDRNNEGQLDPLQLGKLIKILRPSKHTPPMNFSK